MPMLIASSHRANACSNSPPSIAWAIPRSNSRIDRRYSRKADGISLGYQPNLIARDMALGKGVSLTRSAESEISGQTASAEPEPVVVVADPVVVESPSLPPVMAVPEPVAVVVPVEPVVVMEPVVVETAVPLPDPVPVAAPEQEPVPVTPPVVVVEPVLAAEPASHHPETPHPGPLPQGAREAETLATPVAAEPVAPEPAIAPEVQEQAPGVMQPETVTVPVSAVETPLAEMADGTATQPMQPVAQPSQY
ncbi:MAG: hypothetical protein WCI03_14950 [bacterium]